MSLENNNDDGNKKEKKDKKSFRKIMDKQGFYIILMLCMVIVAATAIWVDNQEKDHFIGEGPTNPFGDDEQPEVTLVEDEGADSAKEAGRIGEGKPAEDEKQPPKDSKEETKKSPAKATTKTEGADSAGVTDGAKGVVAAEDSKNTKDVKKTEDTKETEDIEDAEDTEDVEDVSSLKAGNKASIIEDMAIPVAGKLILPFADDHLVYHKTLDQWSTHKGIDIQAPEGAPVKAVLDGEVVEVINDTIMGISIAIKHDNGLLTIYSNLSTDAMVEIGEQVKKGQAIGGVGKTASTKTLEGPLLHFQVFKDDKFVNPELYLGEI